MTSISVLHAAIVFPATESFSFRELKMKRGEADIRKLKELISDYKKWFVEAEQRMLIEMERRFGSKRTGTWSRLHGTKAAIRLIGSRREFISLILPVVPAPIVIPVDTARNRLYYWLERNTLVLPKRPQRIYMLHPRRVGEFLRMVREADDVIKTANRWLEEWYPVVERKLREFEQAGVEVRLEKKKLHPVYWYVTPVTLAAEPGALSVPENVWKEVVGNYLRATIVGVAEQFKPIIEAVLTGSGRLPRPETIERKIARTRELARELGFESHLETVLKAVEWVIRHPNEARRRWRSWEDFEDSILSRI